MKYAWIKRQQGVYPVGLMCHCLRVSRSAYYGWCRAQPSARSRVNAILANKVALVFMQNHGTYGTRRIKHILARDALTLSRRRIARLMRAKGLSCKTKRRFRVITTDSKHSLPIAPNRLDQCFTVSVPNQCWVGDITYVRTLTGWLYLAVVMDLFSRKIVGWSMANHMRASLVNDALLMALFKRKPSKGLIWHTDRGSQYASDSHRQILKEHHIVQSMSRKGNCYDNAVSESFFHTLKTELIHHQTFNNQQEAKLNIFQYIEIFYNRTRIHSANDYCSPAEFEKLFYAS